MSELQDKLNSLLSDPAGMAQVVQLAQQLSSTMEPSAAPTPQSGAPTPPPSPNPPPSTALPGGIDLAILENGQYNEEWSLIHLMPQYMAQTARDLKAKRVLTVHHSKYALAKHRWDEPLKNAEEMKNKDSLNVLIPVIGEVVALEK